MDKPVTMVTGVSKGIGKAIAEDLSARGHQVVGLSRTRPGGWFTGSFYAADLADATGLAQVLARIAAEHRVLRLVNNAGISIAAPAEKLSVKDVDDVMGINFRAVLQCTQAVLPAMRAAKFGRIVNLGSRALLGREGRVAYGGSKAAVLSMTRTLALETAKDGITANCVAPGPVETEMFAQNHPHGSAERASPGRPPAHRRDRNALKELASKVRHCRLHAGPRNSPSGGRQWWRTTVGRLQANGGCSGQRSG